MNLRQLIDILRANGLLIAAPDQDPIIGALTVDSRSVTPGSMFMALPGVDSDGHDFVGQAVAAGATVLLVEHPVSAAVPLVRVSNARRASELLAAEWYHRPAKGLKIVGVTGTNGKTTTTGITRHLISNDHDAGSIGTLGAWDGNGQQVPSTAGSLTTPGPVDLQQTFRGMVDRGVRRVVMEASSHALHQRRLDSVSFEGGVFTNLTHEHLDYHGSLEKYAASKLRLAELVRGDGVLAVNADDSAWSTLLTDPRTISWGHHPEAQLRVSDLHYLTAGSHFKFTGRFGVVDVKLPLPGDINVANAAAAAVVALHFGIGLPEIAARLTTAPQIPGRMERLADTPFHVLRDYAHTPDAVQRLLATVRAITHGKIILVFGCGGDRDRQKRPVMGRLAAEGADLTILTSDNPRSEDPDRIIDDIAEFMPARSYQRELDRHVAIASALGQARPGDTVILMGKGHETYQHIGSVKEHFDEKEIVKGLLG